MTYKAGAFSNFLALFAVEKSGHVVIVSRLRKIEDLKTEFELLLGDDGVLLFPTHPTAAPYHNQPLLRVANFAYTGVINMLGLPATQCPLGLGSWGVPLGVQVRKQLL